MVTTFSLMQLTIFPFWMIPCAHKSIIMIILVNIFQTVKRKTINTKVAFFRQMGLFYFCCASDVPSSIKKTGKYLEVSHLFSNNGNNSLTRELSSSAQVDVGRPSANSPSK